ncbi:unnamed protein product [Pleuronectes platessa]|uniref:Uncharacterized protein n=1 Tax=Pleuronectes platessa TaxID=8262 RepID=A0A9N7UGK6_PLEPL|nr:unnamed protein product [Pleuronectes platessa]
MRGVVLNERVRARVLVVKEVGRVETGKSRLYLPEDMEVGAGGVAVEETRCKPTLDCQRGSRRTELLGICCSPPRCLPARLRVPLSRGPLELLFRSDSDLNSARERRRPQGVNPSQRLTDPQSTDGAERVTSHRRMSQPSHNPCMRLLSGHKRLRPSPPLKCSNGQKGHDIRDERTRLENSPRIVQEVSVESGITDIRNFVEASLRP